MPATPNRTTASFLASLIRIGRNLLMSNKLPSCRFVPSCSVYAQEALTRYGVLRGGWMAVTRLLRCHPLARGGADPVA